MSVSVFLFVFFVLCLLLPKKYKAPKKTLSDTKKYMLRHIIIDPKRIKIKKNN
jgi:hypothetical protein